MPIVTLYYKDIEALVGTDRKTFIERVPMMGADIERIEEDHIDIEFFPNRPDLYSPEGVARAMRGILDIETGLPEYDVHASDFTITLDESIKQVRPYLGCAVVRGLKFDDYSIQSLMGLQEDLHWVLGRDRKKVSIGVHDISRVKPPFKYVAADPGFSFVPLDFDVPMTMREILSKHPKGIKYAHLMAGFDRYPLILDAKDQVLSFPPIINGELTRVDYNTRDLFIDVTGLDSNVYTALNIVVTSLAERGASIEHVTINNSIEGTLVTPDLTPEKWHLAVNEVDSLAGFKLSPQQIVQQLKRTRYDASIKGDHINVRSPAYRSDIMHTWDLVEDILIGFGYDRIMPVLPGTLTAGKQHPVSLKLRKIIQIMVGLGYYQVMPFTLTSENVHYSNMLRHPDGTAVPVKHPISEEQTMVRTSILPNLMEILALNQHRELPQRIFEVGDVVIGLNTRQHLAGVSIHPAANYTEIRGIVDAVLREAGIKYAIEDAQDPAFLKGRRASITSENNVTGVLGEIHPDVITNFGLQQPVIGFELEI